MTENNSIAEDAEPRPFSFGPRDFVHGPYVECPSCHEMQFGVVSIHGQGYSRRCRGCLYPIGTGSGTLVHFPLPKLCKKIIYPDQLMISEMMKSLNPKTEANKQNRVREEWRTAFEKLDALCKLQVAVCPASSFQHDESYVYSFYQALKRIYDLLSHGISFHNPDRIKNAQLFRHLEAWLASSKEVVAVERRDALPTNIDSWPDTIQIDIRSDYVSDFADDIRQERSRASTVMEKLFLRWQKETTKRFSDWYDLEIREFGIGLIEQHDAYLENRGQIARGEARLRAEDMFPPLAFDQVEQTYKTCYEKLGDAEKALAATIQYLRAADFSTLPSVRIMALLIAAIARRAASGQKRVPSQGMVNDMRMVAILLPYCDAMFLDREMHNLLSEPDVRDRLGFDTKLFSPADFGSFFTYLDEIKAGISDDHMKIVREVYGDGAGKPFVEVFEVDDEAAAPRPPEPTDS